MNFFVYLDNGEIFKTSRIGKEKGYQVNYKGCFESHDLKQYISFHFYCELSLEFPSILLQTQSYRSMLMI